MDGTPSSTPDAAPTSRPTLTPEGEGAVVVDPFLISISTETNQTIYLWQAESGQFLPLRELPPQMSLHQQEVTILDNQGQMVERTIPAGLHLRLMYLSPDARTLALLQPALGGRPNYLHQMDLTSGEIVSIKLLEDFQLTIPGLPARAPIWQGGPPRYEVLRSVEDIFQNLVWRPDSSGFAFTIGVPISIIGDDPQQLYFVERGSEEVLLLGADAPGIDIGHRAQWSPDGRYISCQRPSDLYGSWMIDMEEPRSAVRVAPRFTAIVWSADGASYFFEDYQVEGDQLTALLQRSDPETNSPSTILSLWGRPDELIRYMPIGQSSISGRLIVSEQHKTAVDPEAELRIYEFDPATSRLLVLDLDTGETTTSLDGMGPYDFSPAPSNDVLLVKDRKSEEAFNLDTSTGSITHGPSAELYRLAAWSPDSRFLAGTSETQVLIFDLETGELLQLSVGVRGEIVFLGWVPDQSVFDEVLANP
ncbi:MAG: hypothetical protein ACC700_16840 [Anaerolineales bacterium]